jgi:hypothetical protein
MTTSPSGHRSCRLGDAKESIRKRTGVGLRETPGKLTATTPQSPGCLQQAPRRFHPDQLALPWRACHALGFCRPASPQRALPSGVLGPVLQPPWNLQRIPLFSNLHSQGVPLRVLAPQVSPCHVLRFPAIGLRNARSPPVTVASTATSASVAPRTKNGTLSLSPDADAVGAGVRPR